MGDLVPDLELKFHRYGRPPRDLERAFAIMRVAKIKTLGNMGASLQHTFRERETPNADLSRTPENTILIGPDTSDAVLDAWRGRAPEKIRKNAVHGLEYFVGASPEKMRTMSRKQQDAYFADALAWLQKRHGAENILSAVVHRDETTPHMTVMTIPLDDRGKLNARSFVGSRKHLSQLQTDFAAEVGTHHELQRGQLRSSATHERVRRVYGYMQDLPMTVELPERAKGGLLGIKGEKEHEYRERLSQGLSEALTGIVLRHDLEARGAEDRIAALTRRLETTQAAAEVHEKASTLLDRILTAYEAAGRSQELVDMVNAHEQSQDHAHAPRQYELQTGPDLHRHHDLQARTTQERQDHSRDDDLDFEL